MNLTKTCYEPDTNVISTGHTPAMNVPHFCQAYAKRLTSFQWWITFGAYRGKRVCNFSAKRVDSGVVFAEILW